MNCLKMSSQLLVAGMCVLMFATQSEAGRGGRGIFAGGGQARAERGGLFNRMADRREQKLAQVEARIGPEKMERRIRFWNNFAAFAGGLADGMSSYNSAASQYGPQPLPGSHNNYYHMMQQLDWADFNRNYSTNPDHAPVP